MRPEVPDLDAVADVVVSTVRAELGPVVARLAAAESELTRARDVLDALRDRVTGVESKSHAPVDLTPLFERIAVLETRPAVPGPPGPAGPPGSDGKDGAVGMRYRGVWGKSLTAAEVGDFVTHGGAMWLCLDKTTATPGTSRAWTLTVKNLPDRGGD